MYLGTLLKFAIPENGAFFNYIIIENLYDRIY